MRSRYAGVKRQHRSSAFKPDIVLLPFAIPTKKKRAADDMPAPRFLGTDGLGETGQIQCLDLGVQITAGDSDFKGPGE